jgi:hypothetical protein
VISHKAPWTSYFVAALELQEQRQLLLLLAELKLQLCWVAEFAGDYWPQPLFGNAGQHRVNGILCS